VTHTTTQGVRFLDLDGDGVPDAVLTTETWADDPGAAAGGGGSMVVETLETGIGIDGRASDVSVHAHH
jgi:hypothetical protein